MNLFDPRTFSTDWEIMVVDRLERCVQTDKIAAFAGALERDLGLPVHIDWNTLECAMGVNASLDQIWERIRTVTDRATQAVREWDCDLFPAGAHPIEPMFNASHIHVGTIHDESGGIHLEHRLLAYTPAFAALAANSPFAGGRIGGYKSYRVRYQAHGCTRPADVRDPAFSQGTWGFDAGTKMQGAPTVEVRVPDCASSRRLLAEMATFVAAYVHYQGTFKDQERPSAEAYRDALTNRWSAARHGLQATFAWKGTPRPVAEILDEMLDECADALGALGARRSDLRLVNAMIEKRVCQADWALGLAERYPDTYLLASAYSKLARHWDIFDAYVAEASALDPVPLPDEDAILAEHLAVIGEGTHFYRSREAMSYPPPVADAMVERLIERGLIRRDIVEQQGTLLTRIA